MREGRGNGTGVGGGSGQSERGNGWEQFSQIPGGGWAARPRWAVTEQRGFRRSGTAGRRPVPRWLPGQRRDCRTGSKVPKSIPARERVSKPQSQR